MDKKMKKERLMCLSQDIHGRETKDLFINGKHAKAPCVENILKEAADEDELNRLKSWLFKENVRIISAAKELEHMQEQFAREKEQFQEEMKILNQRVTASRQRLRQDEQFFDKKMEILKNGFAQLEADRKAFEREKEAFRKREADAARKSSIHSKVEEMGVFFAGVKNQLALKKRYKDLLKIYHPDNLAGDKEMMQQISREYEHLKRQL